MKRIFCTIVTMLALTVSLVAQNTAIYKSQGGDAMTVGSGGTLTVASGGVLTVASGGTVTLPSASIAAASIASGSLGSGVKASSIAVAGFYSSDPVRSALGLAIGTNVQAYDADLTTYAGITPSANIQSLLGSADYAAARTNLGVSTGVNVQAYDSDLDDLADGSLTGSKVGSGVPAANIAAGSLGSEVMCSSISASVAALLTTVAAGNVTAGNLANTVIVSSVGANGVRPGSIVAGAIVNADINASAAITDGKLAQITTASKVALTALASGTMDAGVAASSVAANGVRPGSVVAGAIVNADINASAAIAKTKLASLDIVNADVNASAGIVDTKLATISTAGKVNASALTGSFPITVTVYQNSDCELLTPSGLFQFCADTTDKTISLSTSTETGGFAVLTLTP